MAEGVRLVSVRRGVDPRRFALFAFGGAAGLHATDIARQLGLARVVVPRVAAVLSAWGMLATDLRFEVSRTHIGDAGALDGAAVKHLFDDMEEEGMRRLRASFDGAGARLPLGRYALWRAGLRDHGAARRRGLGPPPDPLPQIIERFHRRHEALYTYAMPDQESVLVNARVDRLGYSRRIAARAEPATFAPSRAPSRAPPLPGPAGWRHPFTASTRSHRGSASPARR